MISSRDIDLEFEREEMEGGEEKKEGSEVDK